MAKFAGDLFDSMCEFVAEPGSTNSLWRVAMRMEQGRSLLHSYLRVVVFETISPDMFRHGCISRLLVNDELYARPIDLFFMMEFEAEAWPRTHHLLGVQASRSTNKPGYSNLTSGRYGQVPLVMTLVSVRRAARESFRTVDMQVELFSVRPAKVCEGLEARGFFRGRNIYPTSVQSVFFRSVSSLVGHLEYQGFHQHQHVRPSAATGNRFKGPDSHRLGGTIADGSRGGSASLHPVSRDEGPCSAVPSNINVVFDLLVSTMEGRGDSTATGTTSAIQDIATVLL